MDDDVLHSASQQLEALLSQVKSAVMVHSHASTTVLSSTSATALSNASLPEKSSFSHALHTNVSTAATYKQKGGGCKQQVKSLKANIPWDTV